MERSQGRIAVAVGRVSVRTLSILFMMYTASLWADDAGMEAAAGIPAAAVNAGEPRATADDEVSVSTVCRNIAGKLSSVGYNECMQRQLTLSGATSVQGQPILIKEYPPLDQRVPQARVLLLGGIHGDEYSSISVVFKWMNILDRYHSGLFHWHFIPLLNPDGLLRERSRRTNANGVDLNRNFPTPNWREESQKYWVQQTNRNPRRYPGPAPLSEPESRWLASLIEQFSPDAVVAVHAPYGVLDFDGPSDAPKRLGQLHLNLLGTYPGSLGNYAGVQKQIPVVTIELTHAGLMPSEAEISQIWLDLVRWLRVNIDGKARRIASDTQTGPS